MSETAPEQLDTWAIVEALGHRRAVGKVTEAIIALAGDDGDDQ